MGVDRVYYSMEGYPCSKEQAEAEATSFNKIKEAMEKYSKKLPNTMIGKIIVFGTGGDIDNKSKSFKELWDN